MPIYAYRCATCGHAQDVLQKMSDPVLNTCPACGAATYVKQVTAAGFQLKGSGWYVTDFRGEKKAGKAADSADGKGDSGDKPDKGDPSAAKAGDKGEKGEAKVASGGPAAADGDGKAQKKADAAPAAAAPTPQPSSAPAPAPAAPAASSGKTGA